MSELNELSKKSLGRYVKKAAADYADPPKNLSLRNTAKRMIKREKGMDTAIDKLTRESELLIAVLNKKPVDFKTVFEAEIKERVTALTADYKAELHKRVFEIASVSGGMADATGDKEDDVEDTAAKDEGSSGDMTQPSSPTGGSD